MSSDPLHVIRGCLLLALIGLAGADCMPAHAQPDQATGAGTIHIIDFSGLPKKGVLSGNFNNFAFAIDRARLEHPAPATAGRMGRGLVATFDYADCSKGQESVLEKPLAGLEEGAAVRVEHVDIELLPPAQRDLKWTGGVCYGTRAPDGEWRWHLTSMPLAYDAATNRVRARVSIKDGPITAIKLVFDYAVPNLYTQKLILTVSPDDVDIQKPPGR